MMDIYLLFKDGIGESLRKDFFSPIHHLLSVATCPFQTILHLAEIRIKLWCTLGQERQIHVFRHLRVIFGIEILGQLVVIHIHSATKATTSRMNHHPEVSILVFLEFLEVIAASL